jgi:hypothetical protein
VGGGAFGLDACVGVEDELGEFARGGAVVEAVEVDVFLEGDEAVFVDMVQRSLQAFYRAVWEVNLYLYFIYINEK